VQVCFNGWFFRRTGDKFYYAKGVPRIIPNEITLDDGRWKVTYEDKSALCADFDTAMAVREDMLADRYGSCPEDWDQGNFNDFGAVLSVKNGVVTHYKRYDSYNAADEELNKLPRVKLAVRSEDSPKYKPIAPESKEALQAFFDGVKPETVKTKETPMPETKVQILNEANEAGYRIAVRQLVKLVHAPLAAMFTAQFASEADKDGVKAKVELFLASEPGVIIVNALLAGTLTWVVSSGMTIPGVDKKHIERLSTELRISTMERGGNVVADMLMGPLQQVIAGLVGNIPKVEEPATLDAPRRVGVNGNVTKVNFAG
jgi:hypothetical protein